MKCWISRQFLSCPGVVTVLRSNRERVAEVENGKTGLSLSGFGGRRCTVQMCEADSGEPVIAAKGTSAK